MKWAAAVLLTVCAASAHAGWLSYDDAMAKARQEQKPILLYLRANCERCNREADEFLAAAEQHEPIARSYDSFVLARVESVSKAPQALRAQKPPAPAVLMLDPSGAMVLWWKRWDLDVYLNFLRLARNQLPLIVSAAQLRDTDPAEADYALATAAMQTMIVDEARDLYRRAEGDFRRRGNVERATLARYGADVSGVLMNDKTAITDLDRTIHGASTPTAKANGYLSRASLHLVFNERQEASRALHAALDVAPPGSPEAERARSQLAFLGEAGPADAKATPEAVIKIVPPDRATVTGRADFSATAAPNVKRVAWFVDGVPVASSSEPPFRERLDLGSIPRVHTIFAFAFDASGTAVARAVTTVNDRLDFKIALVSPVATTVSGETLIEAAVDAPPDRAVKQVELFWDEKRIASLTAAPYRASFVVPPSFGYIRAVATLDDGRTAEETRLVNSPSLGEVVDVHDIAFAATVVDRDGNRIEGLKASDFRATDAGQPVAVRLRDDNDAPVTIGLAIDSSASMRNIYLRTMEAAWKFLDVVASPHDRIFLVAFDARPHLIQSPTSDREAMRRAVFDMIPSGGTAAIDAVAFSLQQFSGLPGRKALVVLTDADEQSSTQTSGAAERMAKESGVPIYLIVPERRTAGAPLSTAIAAGGNGLPFVQQGNHSPQVTPANVPAGDLSAARHTRAFGNALIGIAEASGGLAIVEPKPESEAAIFEKIRDEVRAQYLLAFASKATTPGIWRDVKVEVARPNATVRTITGYFAR